MPFKPKITKNKVSASYRTLYINDELKEKVEKIAKEENTSFNNAVISMIEYCIDENEKNHN